jgi:hypothetical protein
MIRASDKIWLVVKTVVIQDKITDRTFEAFDYNPHRKEGWLPHRNGSECCGSIIRVVKLEVKGA